LCFFGVLGARAANIVWINKMLPFTVPVLL
jgi:hypothetical protein